MKVVMAVICAVLLMLLALCGHGQLAHKKEIVRLNQQITSLEEEADELRGALARHQLLLRNHTERE